MPEMRKLRDIPQSDRPREKLQQKGPEALSDIELIAILLGSGTKGHDVMKVSGRILKVLDGTAKQPGIEELQQIEGIGLAKATLTYPIRDTGGRSVKDRKFVRST